MLGFVRLGSRVFCIRECAVTSLHARHVKVAFFIVKNRPEITERSRRSFPTPAGWFFTNPTGSSSRPSAARAGTHNHRRVIMGPRNGVPRDGKSAFTRVCDALCVAGGPSRGRPEWDAVGSFGQNAPLAPRP